jgi:hypothetical protein
MDMGIGHDDQPRPAVWSANPLATSSCGWIGQYSLDVGFGRGPLCHRCDTNEQCDRENPATYDSLSRPLPEARSNASVREEQPMVR